MRPGIDKSLAAKMVHEVVEIQKISSIWATTSNAVNEIDSWATSLEEDLREAFKIESDEEFNALFELGKASFERSLNTPT